MNLKIKSRRPYLIGAFILLSFLVFGAVKPLENDVRASFQTQNTTVHLEVADTAEERERGLMFREELDENHGMLFVYEEEAPRSFWMKNTLIPLDIIFLGSDKTIINIEKAYPEPNTSDSNLERYRSESPAQYVIEVNQNFTERKGIEKGDRVEFTLSR